MTVYDTDLGAAEHSDRHVPAVLSSAAVSTLLHVLLVYLVSVLSFTWPLKDVIRPPVRSAPPLRVNRVQRQADIAQGGSRNGASGRGTWAEAGGRLQNLARVTPEVALQPNTVAIEPAPLPENALTGDAGNTVEPAEFPKLEPWDPRQAILAIEQRVVADKVPALARRMIPRIARVSRAPDVALPLLQSVDLLAAPLPSGVPAVPAAAAGVTGTAGGAPGHSAAVPRPGIGGTQSTPTVLVPGVVGGALFGETKADISQVRPIDEFLKVRVVRYSSPLDPVYDHFQIEVSRARDDVLPVIPKDVVFVQDSSNSMTEQRLYFCRLGLVKCLELVGAEDRFNVVSFQEQALFCFPDWQAPTPDARARARRFCESLTAAGNTDILTSLQSLKRLVRTPGRPVIVYLISDGRSTTGLTDSAAILSRFTRENDGTMSVYTLGTVATANTYLLEMIGYCNRGNAREVERGRWDIPDAMADMVRQSSRPVLADVRIRLVDTATFEVYPVLTSNLYLDRPLVLYGRHPKGYERLVLQATGQAGKLKCDMIFDIDLQFAEKSTDPDIRAQWARQKAHHLIGQYARKADPVILNDLIKTASEYGIAVPYADRVGLP